MATLVKTSTGAWKAVIRKLGWPTAAKTFRTKRDAQDWARRTEDEMVRGVYIERAPSERMTLSKALDRYLKEVTPTKKASTRRVEKGRAEQLRHALGQYSLAALSADTVARYRDDRLAAGKSSSTVRLELALLGHLYTVAIKEWRLGLATNPVASIRRPSPAAGRDRRLARNEDALVIRAADNHSNPMFGWIVRLAIETGMRSSEIVGLQRGDVDLKRRVVRLSDTKNHSARLVPLTKNATQVLEAALANPARPKDVELVFYGEPGRDGQRRPYVFQKHWSALKKSLGIDNLRFHDLRHEAVSRLVEAGLSDQEVAAISGHKSMQMLRRYTHLRTEDLVAKLDRLGGASK